MFVLGKRGVPAVMQDCAQSQKNYIDLGKPFLEKPVVHPNSKIFSQAMGSQQYTTTIF